MTRALTYAGMLLFFRNETGFGGNNGFTGFTTLLGFPITAAGTRVALFPATVLLLAASPYRLCAGAQQIRPGADRGARCGKPADLLRLRSEGFQAVRLDAVGGAVRAGRRALCAAGRHH